MDNCKQPEHRWPHGFVDIDYLEEQMRVARENEGKTWREVAKWVSRLIGNETRRCARLTRCSYNDSGYDCACDRCRLAARFFGLEWNDECLGKEK
jgi:hypothetical protein